VRTVIGDGLGGVPDPNAPTTMLGRDAAREAEPAPDARRSSGSLPAPGQLPETTSRRDRHRHGSTSHMGRSHGSTSRIGSASQVHSGRQGSSHHSGPHRRAGSSGRFTAARDSQRMDRQTHQGQILGSPAYMSPEQGRGASSEADQRTDIYSLGAMLMELLCLHTPVESGPSDTLATLIQRVKSGQRTKLSDHWQGAPPALVAICEGALAHDPQQRFPTCEVFSRELRQLLTQLSASYAELERQRLERERQEAWLPSGLWDFGASRNLGPLETTSVAIGAEQVGQVHHPELGGIILGGYGLQCYPLSARPGDDVRVTIQVSLLRGAEFWICVRGAPPAASYQFRIGAFGGRWLAVARADRPSDVLVPTLLSLRPMRDRSTTMIGARDHEMSYRVVVESAGARLRLLCLLYTSDAADDM
jgi:hypothetical protein